MRDLTLGEVRLWALLAICCSGILFSVSYFNPGKSIYRQVQIENDAFPKNQSDSIPQLSMHYLTEADIDSSRKTALEPSHSIKLTDAKYPHGANKSPMAKGPLATMSVKNRVGEVMTLKDPARSYFELSELEKVAISCPKCAEVLDHFVLISGNSIGQAELIDLIRSRDDFYFRAYYSRMSLGLINPDAFYSLLYYERAVGNILAMSDMDDFLLSPGNRSLSKHIYRTEENKGSSSEFEGLLEGLDMSILTPCARDWVNDHISQGDELKVRDIGFAHQHCGEGLFPYLM